MDNAKAEYKKKNSDYNDKSFISYDQGASNSREIQEQCGVGEDRADEIFEGVNDYTDESRYIKDASHMSEDEYLDKYICHDEDDYLVNKAKADAAEEYILKSPKFTGELMRGMGLSQEKFDKLMKQVKNKEPITDLGLSSWSQDKEIALEFSVGGKDKPYRVVHVLKHGTAKGTPITNLSVYDHEQEILISASERRIATGKIEKVKDGDTIVYFIEEEEIFE